VSKTRDRSKRKDATPESAAESKTTASASADEEVGAPAEAAPAAAKDEAPAAEGLRDSRIVELEDEVARLREEAAASADRALRTLAEFDNYRKRAVREHGSAVGQGKAQVLRELLEVVDNFDRALEHAGEDVPVSFLEGMELVARGLHDLLDRQGVARIEAVGAVFDPERHEALTMQPSEDAEPNTVLQEVQPGYTLGDRVLRPTKVIVAARPVAPPSGDGDRSAEDEPVNEKDS
jgi:molecular chaperone GrpE